MSNGVLCPIEGGCYRGNVHTLAIALPIKLVPITGRATSPDAPKYDVLTQTRANGEPRTMKIGSAWEKLDRHGEVFLTLTLDDPSWEAPLYVSAFPRDGGNFEIVWQRPKRKAPGEGGRQAPAGDEEMPF